MCFKSSVPWHRGIGIEYMVSVPFREALKLSICNNICYYVIWCLGIKEERGLTGLYTS